MAAPVRSSFPPSHSPPKRRESSSAYNNHSSRDNDAASGDIVQSLSQLSLSAASPARSPGASPKPQWPTLHKTSSSTSLRRSASKSSLNGTSAVNGRESCAGTPSLTRKTSLQSLHSASGFPPARRGSSTSLMSPSMSTMAEAPEKPPLTAASIAHAHFKKDLEVNHGANSTPLTETVVILHDSCYGHRFSRPRTSRSSLSTIVERPERIKACVLGVSLAYVRLGDRHSEGTYPVHPKLDPGLIPSVPFRIHKTTRRLPIGSQAVTNVHGTKWMEELKIMCDSAEARLAMNGKELQRPEMYRGPDEEAPRKLHEGDLYLCAESLEAFEGALGAVCEAVDTVFDSSNTKRAFVAVRPPGHHCSASFPSGFCWVNNVHVGIMHGILGHGLTHAAIIDFDLHHGDGSQGIAWHHNARGVGLGKNAAWWKKTSIGYFSLHDINSYPCEMGDEEKVKNASLCIENAHGQNIWNVHLHSWKSETEFWELYETRYSILLDKARVFLKQQTQCFRASNQTPKGAIFLSAGFDASEWEGSGMQRHNVNVPTEFYARLTRDVIRIAAEEGTGVEGRVISVLEGGYSDRALCSGVLSHLSGLAGEDPVTKEEDYNGLGYEMGSRIGAVNGRRESWTKPTPIARPYEPSWWSRARLEQFEAAIAPPPSPTEPQKQRNVSSGNFTAPTASSQAKVATPKLRRSASAMSMRGSPAAPSRPPSPPLPEVHWTVSAHELSKLLIPSDRQTDSCQPEDLSAEATRARRDRQHALPQSQPGGSGPLPTVPPVPAGPTRMSLRERKPTKPITSISEEEDMEKNRRRTVHGVRQIQYRPSHIWTVQKTNSHQATATPRKAGRPAKQPSRRLSAASTIVTDLSELELPPPSTANGASRPTTSDGTQHPSSTSVRTAASSVLNVKKTRPAGPPKKEDPKTRAVKKPSASAPNSASKPPRPGTAASSGDQSSDGMMEKLTSGMRKIKINVITKAQREAGGRERAEREKLAAGTPIQSSVPGTPATIPEEGYTPSETERSISVKSSDGASDMRASSPFAAGYTMQQAGAGLSSGPQTPYHEQPPVLYPTDPQQVPLPGSSPGPSTPAAAPQPQPQPPQVQVSTPDMFIPYQPEGPPPAAMSQHEPLKWLPPNVSATPTPMKRSDLPVFTATSAIPFAPGGARAGMPPPAPPLFKVEAPPKPEGQHGERSAWDRPETPQK